MSERMGSQVRSGNVVRSRDEHLILVGEVMILRLMCFACPLPSFKTHLLVLLLGQIPGGYGKRIGATFFYLRFNHDRR